MNDPTQVHVTDWSKVNVSVTDQVIAKIGAFILDDIVTVRDLLRGETPTSTYEELVKLYREKPERATALGLYYLVSEGFLSNNEADEIARRASYGDATTAQIDDLSSETITDKSELKNVVDLAEKQAKLLKLSGHLSQLKPALDSVGLHVILGASSSGKSRLIHEIGRALNEPLYYFSEPDHRTKGDAKLATMALRALCHYNNGANSLYKDEWGSDGDLSKASNFLQSLGINPASKILLFDSLKDILYIGGNLGRGGVSMSALSDLSLLAGQLQLAGVTVVTIVNPLRDDLLTEIMDSLVGSVTGAWFISAQSINCQFRTFNGHYYERKDITVGIKWLSNTNDGLVFKKSRSIGAIDIESIDEGILRVPDDNDHDMTTQFDN